MEERRLGQPRSDLERAAQHFGVPEGEVTLEMLGHVEGIPRGSGLARSEIDGLATMVASEVTDNLLLHSVPYIEGSPGIAVDENAAKATPCTCYGPVCFSKGIVGALSSSQKEWACNPRIEGKSPGMERRLKHWKEAVSTCKAEIEEYPKGERLMPWLTCMGRELPKKGIEI